MIYLLFFSNSFLAVLQYCTMYSATTHPVGVNCLFKYCLKFKNSCWNKPGINIFVFDFLPSQEFIFNSALCWFLVGSDTFNHSQFKLWEVGLSRSLEYTSHFCWTCTLQIQQWCVVWRQICGGYGWTHLVRNSLAERCSGGPCVGSPISLQYHEIIGCYLRRRPPHISCIELIGTTTDSLMKLDKERVYPAWLLYFATVSW